MFRAVSGHTRALQGKQADSPAKANELGSPLAGLGHLRSARDARIPSCMNDSRRQPKILTLRVTDELMRRLDAIAAVTGDTRSRVARILLGAESEQRLNGAGEGEMEPCSMTTT